MKRRPANRVAVAINYEPEEPGPPTVVAAGVDDMARRILELARREQVHIHKNSTLTDLLAHVPSGADIPRSAYLLIAELLSFLYATDRRLAEKLAAARRKFLPAGKYRDA